MREVAVPAVVLLILLVVVLTWALQPSDLERALSARAAGRHAEALAALEPLAAAGDPDAQFALAGMLAAGPGGAVPPTAAMDWLRKAAGRDHVGAAMALGAHLAPGGSLAGQPGALGEALDWYRRAAALGDSDAYARVRALADAGVAQARLALGRMYAQRVGGLNARHEAPRHLRMAAEQGLAEARDDLQALAADGVFEAALELAALAERGRPRAPDLAAAARWYARAAELGDSVAQFRLAVRHAQGRGVPRDPAQAADWYERAARQGHPEALLSLAALLVAGEGRPRDDAAAVAWYSRALALGRAEAIGPLQRFAESGAAEAQYALGRLHHEGKLVPLDDAQAVGWMQRAAAQGHALARFEVAFHYAEGLGVPRDTAQAARWYQEAAAAGHPIAMTQLRALAGAGEQEAQYRYGRHLAHGAPPAPSQEREPADLIEAVARFIRNTLHDPVDEGVDLLRAAASADHSGAQFELGRLYEAGTGVSQDARLAREWFAKAAGRGHVEAGEHLRPAH